MEYLVGKGIAADRLESEGYKAQVVSRAEGEARRFDQLLAAFEQAPDVTRQRLYLETVEAVLAGSKKVLMQKNGSGNVTYLPLDKLLERVPAQRAETDATAVPDPDLYTAPGDAAARLRDNSRLRGTR